MTRAAIEFPLSDGTTLRGVRVGGGGRGVVLALHDLGRDLDEFGPLPEMLAGEGFDVLLVDLPGHGLSDGETARGNELPGVAGELVEQIADRGPLALVASGRTASVGVVLGAAHGLAVQILMNPRLDREIVDAGQRAYASRLVFHAAGEHLVGSEVQQFVRLLIGERLMIHHHAVDDGVSAAVRDGTVRSHLTLFLQRYLGAAVPDSRPAPVQRGESP